MRIGISCPVRFSVFSSGVTPFALNLYKYLEEFGHNVTLLNTGSTLKNWYDDCTLLAEAFKVISCDALKGLSSHDKYDLIIDIDGGLAGDFRRSIANYVVVFIRKPAMLTDIESIVYPANKAPRSIDDVDAIWVYDYISDSDVRYLSLLTHGKPIIRVPFLWRPTIIDAHYKETGFTCWKGDTDSLWQPHVMETNMTNTSSCTIPLVIFRQLALKKSFPFKEFTIHNMDQLNNSEYFRDNVKSHCAHESLTGNFISRQRSVDLVVKPKSVMVSHIRFLPFRPIHLDTLWVGIPLVHNSVMLKEMGCGLERLYYRDNDILDACDVFSRLESDFNAKTGIFTHGGLEKIREEILKRFGCYSENQKKVWADAIGLAQKIVVAPVVVSPAPVVIAPAPVVIAPAPVVVAPAPVVVVPAPVVVAPAPVVVAPAPVTVKKEYSVLFTDMWDSFNPEYNFFLLLLQESSKKFPEPVSVKGYSLDTIDSITPDLIIFGPFGETWRIFPLIPKIHFTGENSLPITEENIKLNLGFSLLERTDGSYMRLPLWMLEIDWFGANPDKIVNPKPLPVDRVTTPALTELSDHQTNFCAFVVTNPLNPIRNDSFVWLSSYKEVHSAGRLFNNVGDVIYAGLGGGGGELKKYEFLKKYKFSLCYENSSAEGYTTEKLLHAKAAGCIPIYWGDPKVARDFNSAGFLNAQSVTNSEELIQLVRSIDENPEKYEAMYNAPLLDSYRFELVRRRLSELARRFWKILGASEDVLRQIPKFLGATTTAEAAQLAAEREGVSNMTLQIKTATKVNYESTEIIEMITSMIFVTFATYKYIPALEIWINIMKQHKQQLRNIQCHVYLGQDIPDIVYNHLVEKNHDFHFIKVPQIEVPNFPDFWEPQHFAWKIWLYSTVVSTASYKNKLVFYMDVGIAILNIPHKYIMRVLDNGGIAVIEDKSQINKHWCHETFCDALNVTDAEKADNQILGGIMIFIGGSLLAEKFFSESLAYGKQRHIIVGHKWEGIGSDGKYYGHRHDQSIMSIISSRLKIARYPLEEIYCNYSFRRTLKKGVALYVHRGEFSHHKNFLDKISEAYVINLKRRSDRLEQFYENHPGFDEHVLVQEACDGVSLELTPALKRLFINNDFHWKKPVLGCAMSHLKLWQQLATDEAGIDNYLIMEDDVKFQKGWQEIWNKASKEIPDDYDVLYLGGILPPNKEGYNSLIQPVNDYWGRIKEHTLFGQASPNRYFHVCNYSYILSKKGAQKILDNIIARGGYYTSADHMICNQIDFLNHYFLTPLVAGSYQDDDPKYANSQFNDFNRVDNFDSDLWNNNERFDFNTVDTADSGELFSDALRDAFTAPVKTEIIGKESVTTSSEHLVKASSNPIPETNNVATLQYFYTVGDHKMTTNQCMEMTWITDLLTMNLEREFGKGCKIVTNDIKHLDSEHKPLDNSPIFIVQRPYIEMYIDIFARYNNMEKPFYVLHLSDEYSGDNISWYSLPFCKGIVRTYMRDGLDDKKVLVIPLGYVKRANKSLCQQITQTPSLPFRELAWSFRGTGWQNREEKLNVLKNIEPAQYVFYKEWLDSSHAKREEYVGELLNSKFVPCPGGMNPETFRLYEALELGAIPIYVRQEGDELYFKYLSNIIPIINMDSWDYASKVIVHMLANPEVMEKYRESLLMGWIVGKKRYSESIKNIFAQLII
jgi:GR25 family glycosyltransferase involved in LPS biosynthesis